jgi:hypothetical protein
MLAKISNLKMKSYEKDNVNTSIAYDIDIIDAIGDESVCRRYRNYK